MTGSPWRPGRRAIVIVTGLVRVAILVLLTTLIVTRHVDVAVVLAVLFLFGVTETFGDTTTSTLLAPCCSRPGGRCRSSARAGACWPGCC